jgi:hypothetical protein
VSLEYIAGFLDADGSIWVRQDVRNKNGDKCYLLVVDFANTNKAVLESIQNELGSGSMYSKTRHSDKHKDTYDLKIVGVEAVQVVEKLLPHIVLKRKQAEIALKIQAEYTAGNNPEREFIELRTLNKRGKNTKLKIRNMCIAQDCKNEIYGHNLCRMHYRWKYEAKNQKAESGHLCATCQNALPVKARPDTKFCSTSCRNKWHRRYGCYRKEKPGA